jgi:hypothetical protein
MRAWVLVSTLILATSCAGAVQAMAAGTLHIRPGLYAPNASETTREDYSNGGVNLVVAKGGRKITEAGISCYTGSAPTDGLPANDEVTIRVPHLIAITATGTFSFSGPVTLTPEETQSEITVTTTFTIKGRFQKGKIAVVGSDSSPICQSQTLTRMRLHYAR